MATPIDNSITILDASYWPYEKGTLVLPVAFYDESDPPVAVTPETLFYTLTTFDGVVINEREDVAVTPNETVNIILTGDDLLVGEFGTDRELAITGTYDSVLANGLSLNQAIRFYIRPLAGVS